MDGHRMNTPITQDALDRLERNLDAKIIERDNALERLISVRLDEHERRISDQNNAHDRAVQEKQRTDQAATEIAERAVKKSDLDAWKSEVNKRLDLAAGAAKTWALIGAIAGSVIAGIIVGILSSVLKP